MAKPKQLAFDMYPELKEKMEEMGNVCAATAMQEIRKERGKKNTNKAYYHCPVKSCLKRIRRDKFVKEHLMKLKDVSGQVQQEHDLEEEDDDEGGQTKRSLLPRFEKQKGKLILCTTEETGKLDHSKLDCPYCKQSASRRQGANKESSSQVVITEPLFLVIGADAAETFDSASQAPANESAQLCITRSGHDLSR